MVWKVKFACDSYKIYALIEFHLWHLGACSKEDGFPRYGNSLSWSLPIKCNPVNDEICYYYNIQVCVLFLIPWWSFCCVSSNSGTKTPDMSWISGYIGAFTGLLWDTRRSVPLQYPMKGFSPKAWEVITKNRNRLSKVKWKKEYYFPIKMKLPSPQYS